MYRCLQEKSVEGFGKSDEDSTGQVSMIVLLLYWRPAYNRLAPVANVLSLGSKLNEYIHL